VQKSFWDLSIGEIESVGRSQQSGVTGRSFDGFDLFRGQRSPAGVALAGVLGMGKA
jgi:hypothetical protein